MAFDRYDKRNLKSIEVNINKLLGVYDGDSRFQSLTDHLRAAADALSQAVQCAEEMQDDEEQSKEKIEDLSTYDSDQIEAAIIVIKEKLKKQGAPEDRIYWDDFMDYRLCMIFYQELEKTGKKAKAHKAVTDFVDSVTYDPNYKGRQPVFPMITEAA